MRPRSRRVAPCRRAGPRRWRRSECAVRCRRSHLEAPGCLEPDRTLPGQPVRAGVQNPRLTVGYARVVIARLRDRVLSIGADGADSSDLRFRKRLLVGIALLILPVAFL